MPFIILSMLVGAFLPALTGQIRAKMASAAEHSTGEDQRMELRSTEPIGERRAALRARAKHFFYDIPEEPDHETDQRTSVSLFMLFGSLALLGGSAWLGTETSSYVWQLIAALYLFTIGPGFVLACLVLWIKDFAYIKSARIEFILDDHGITMQRRWQRVQLRWWDIERIWFDPESGYLRVAAPSANRRRHRAICRMIGRGASRELRGTQWNPKENSVELCKMAWMASPTMPFLESLEQFSGNKIDNKESALP